MDFKLSLTVLCAVLASCATMTQVMSAPAKFELSARAADPVCDTSRAAPYWQSYSPKNTDHYYSTDYAVMNDSTPDGYTIHGHVGFIFREPVASTVGFYRLYNAARTDYFYTTSETEADEVVRSDGYVNRGYVGYIYPSAICGAVPLYRLYEEKQYDHYYTTNETGRDYWLKHGYTSQGIAGYVLPDL